MAIIPNGAITAIAHYIETSEQIVLVRSFLTVCFFALSQIWGRDVLFQLNQKNRRHFELILIDSFNSSARAHFYKIMFIADISPYQRQRNSFKPVYFSSTENANFWPIWANVGYFIANLHTFWRTFDRPE